MYTHSFDTDGRLKTHLVGSDTRTLTYDAASRIINTTDTHYPVYNRSYDYDALDRLISQSDNDGFKLWAYDANSNRTAAQFGGTTYQYTIAAASNRLTHVAGPVAKNYSYNAAGHPLSDGTATFTWNAAGKLATTVKGDKTHTYKYNALDQRIIKNGPLSPRFLFFYDPSGQLIGEYQDNAATTTPTDDWLVRQETVWLGDIPVGVITKPTATSEIQVHFIHADHLNTPRVIVDQTNTIVWRWENMHAFGANLPNEDPDSNGQLFEYHPRFPGQYFDKETGLHYNYFRYYEPETGRYISPDPIGLEVNITIIRDTYTKNTVLGKINVTSTLIPDTYSGNTLEDAVGGDCQCKDLILQGKYNAFIRKDHNLNRIEFLGVPNYTNVQIHIGNSARDVKGCFAVGDTRGLDFVGGSQPAMNKILDIIRKDGSGNIFVNVIGPGRSTDAP